MPVPDALALLRDQNGDVALQLALAPPRVEAGGSYADQVAAGVRDALGRAARSGAAASLRSPCSSRPGGPS